MPATQQRTALQEKLLDYLQDAHAMEQNVLRMLDSMKATTQDPEILARIDRHLRETEQQEQLLRGRLEAWGEGPSMTAEVPAVVGAWIKGLGDRLRSDKPGKNARDAYVTEHLEIAAYHLLEHFAQRAGDYETARVARQNRAQEEEMARWIDQRWEKFIDLTIREGGLDQAEETSQGGTGWYTGEGRGEAQGLFRGLGSQRQRFASRGSEFDLERLKEGLLDHALDLCLAATGVTLAGYLAFRWWTHHDHHHHQQGGRPEAEGVSPLRQEQRGAADLRRPGRADYPWSERRGFWGGFPGKPGDHLGGSEPRGSLAGTSGGSTAGQGVAGLRGSNVPPGGAALGEYVRDIPGSRDQGDWGPADVCSTPQAVPAGKPLPGQGDQPGP